MNCCYVARLHINAGIQKHTVINAMAELERQTQHEPDCLLFRVFETETPHELVILEVFTTPEALQAHYDAEHTKAYFNKGYTEIESFQSLTAIQSLEEVFESRLLQA